MESFALHVRNPALSVMGKLVFYEGTLPIIELVRRKLSRVYRGALGKLQNRQNRARQLGGN